MVKEPPDSKAHSYTHEHSETDLGHEPKIPGKFTVTGTFHRLPALRHLFQNRTTVNNCPTSSYV